MLAAGADGVSANTARPAAPRRCLRARRHPEALPHAVATRFRTTLSDVFANAVAMTERDLATVYRAYIDCLNRRDWASLGQFVHEAVHRNGEHLGLAGYRAMLEGDVRAIPDLQFRVDLLVCEPPRVASRLLFDCTPSGELFGLPVNGRRVRFSENVFYTFEDGRILEVRSIIDRAAIADQLERAA